jgi:ribonucleoside-triphosphate reductase (thioredoxin)
MQNNFLGTEFQSFIHLSRYSRFRQEDNRRETWSETVDRYFDFFTKHLKENNNFDLSNDLRNVLTNTILNLEVMPSMRCMMTAGPALERDNIAGYNCSYLAIDRPAAFDEILYILMNGTGVGFSVERQHITKLPVVAEEFHDTDIVIPIADSKMGWAKGLKETIALLYQGSVPTWDTSKVRPAGSILKTFGGRASGPEPLLELFRFVADVFRNAAGRRLTSLECHDIVCKIAEVVVVGGVRRSALILCLIFLTIE